jgi:hypothetical protein
MSASLALLALFAAAAAAMGHALARNWRPCWHALPYALLLAAAERFFFYALFNGDLLSPAGYGVAAVILILAAAIAFRVTRARRMVAQYPWLYEPAGWFSWRAKGERR